MNSFISKPSEIIPGRIWLSGRTPALDTAWLDSKNIQVVFNCTKDIPFGAEGSIPRTNYRLPVHDNLEPQEIRNMTAWSYETVFKMLREFHAGKNILVHCAAGMQRSAAVVAMFLITIWRQPTQVVVSYMRERRPIVFRPSMNFEDSVVAYEKWYFSLLSNGSNNNLLLSLKRPMEPLR